MATNNLFNSDFCIPGVKDKTTGKWLKNPGKYYNKCPCPDPKVGGYAKCPDGYDLTTKFQVYSGKQLNPIHNSISMSDYSGKSCADIAGKYPYAVAPDKWDPKTFKSCLNFYKLQKGVETQVGKLNTVSNIYSNMNNTEQFSNQFTENFSNDEYSSLYSPENGLPKRTISFNNMLHGKIKDGYKILDGQAKSTTLLRRANDEWNDMMGQMHETERQVTNSMQVKTRLAEINNAAARQKSSAIMYILGAFSAMFISILGLVGYLSGNVSASSMFGSFVIALIVFFVIAIGFNKYAIKEFKKISDKTEKIILHEGDKLNMDALQWVDDNCDCPEKYNNGQDEVEKREAKDAYDKVMEHQKYDDDSIYYDDGTTKHRIRPSDFARETGYLPCDLQDNTKINYASFETNKNNFNTILNTLNTKTEN